MDDGRIVDLYLARDEAAITETAQKYGARLRALSKNIVGDVQTCEECENDTYLETWNSVPPHEPRSYLFAYLARIIRHLSLNAVRDRNRQKRRAMFEFVELSSELEEVLPAPSDDEALMESEQLGKIISNFLRKLPEEKREIFLRRYWYFDSVSDIAKRYRISESKVKTTLFRCREELRNYLIKEGYSL